MHYTDGTSSEHTIRYGDHVRDWYESPTSKTTLNDPQSQFVWRANHPKSKPNRPINLAIFDHVDRESEADARGLVDAAWPPQKATPQAVFWP